MTQPVLYSPDVEDVRPEEAETIRELNKAFDQILETTYEDYGYARRRSVHAEGARRPGGRSDDRRGPAARAGAGPVRDAGRASGVPAHLHQSGRHPRRCHLGATWPRHEGARRPGRPSARCGGDDARLHPRQRQRLPRP
ncbi:hypothetical protein AB5I41_02420 [Sphingomonas sp. MMS24-JH45]